MFKVIGVDGQEYGPVSVEVLRQWITEGRANAATKVRAENATEWKTLAELPELAAALAMGATTPAPSTPVSSSTAPEQGRTNPLAVTGLILGILSVTIGLCCCSGFPFSVSGIICSGIALSQSGRNPQQQGRGLAIGGLAVSIAGLLLGVIFVIFYGVVSSMPEVMRKLQNL